MRDSRIGAAVVVVAVCVAVGTGLIATPPRYVIALLWAASLATVCVYSARRLYWQDETRLLFGVLLALLVTRIALTFALEPFSETIEFDARLYADHGWAIAEQWRRGEFVSYGQVAPWEVNGVAYVYINAVIYTLLDFNPLAVKVTNAVLGAATVIPVFYLGRVFFTPKVAVAAALVTGCFPSMIFWSTQNLKDTLVVLLVVSSFYCALTTKRSKSFRHTIKRPLLVIGMLLLLFGLRPPTASLVTLWIVGGVVLRSPVEARLGRMGKMVFAIGILAVVLTLSFSADRFIGILSTAASLEEIENWRVARAFGESAFGQGYEVDTLGDLLLYLPAAIVAFLFRPFPWEVSESAMQRLTIVESLIWYPLLLFSAIGIAVVVHERWFRYAVLWGFPVVAVVVGSITFGNLGTAYRHRAQIVPFVALLAVVGFARIIRRQSPFARGELVRNRGSG